METQSITQYLIAYLPNVLAAVILFIIGIIIARFLKKRSLRWINNRANRVVQSFIINFIYIVTLILFGIIVLSKLGVPTASLITLLGAAGLAIGLALKDFLSNVAAGFIIIFLRPFKVGDYINITGKIGMVTDVNLFVVQLKTASNEALFVPNNAVINGGATNFSYYPLRRLDLTIGISYDASIEKAKLILKQLLTENKMAHDTPEPVVAVQKLADSAVELTVRVWVNKENYLLAKFELLEAIKRKFDEQEIGIPFPQTDVHLKCENDKQNEAALINQ